MLKKLMSLIVLSSLMAVTIWNKPVSAMETDQHESFNPICLTLNDSSRMALRLTCTWADPFVESAYTKDMQTLGITRQWDCLAISNTMRYYLSKHACNALWFLNKWHRSETLGNPTDAEKAGFYSLCVHIDRIHEFANKNISTTSLLFPAVSKDPNVRWSDFAITDSLAANYKFNYIHAFPGNDQTLKLETTCLRIHELRDQILNYDNSGDGTFYCFWLELIKIDPHMTFNDFKKAKEAYVDETIQSQMLSFHPPTPESRIWNRSTSLHISMEEFTTLRDLVRTPQEGETVLQQWNNSNNINSPNIYTALCMIYMEEKDNPSEVEILGLKEHYFSSSCGK